MSTRKRGGKPPVDLACPPRLGAGADVWHSVIARMADAGTLGAESLPAVERYVVAALRWRDAETHLANEGVVAPARRTKVPTVSPWLSIARQAAAEMGRLERALGLTPAHRRGAGPLEYPLKADGTRSRRPSWMIGGDDDE